MSERPRARRRRGNPGAGASLRRRYWASAVSAPTAVAVLFGIVFVVFLFGNDLLKGASTSASRT